MKLTPEDLHVIRVYKRLPPEPGGMEQHVAELTAAQRAQGVRVTELYNRGQPRGEALQLIRSFDLANIKRNLIGDLMFYCSALGRSRAIRPDGRIRVVHAHGDWSSFILARALARAVGAKAIAASMHGRPERGDAVFAAALRHCNPIFATGLAEAQRLSAVCGKHVIHLPSAPADLFFEKPQGADSKYDVAAVSSLVAVKQLHLLVECAALRPHLQFAVVGEGPERPAIAALAAARGLRNLHLLGSLSPPQVRSVLHSSKLFVNTSAAEGSPTAALEAMACGLPVVLTPSNDYSSIVRPGENGRVTGGWDPVEISAAIDWFVGHEDRRIAAAAISRRTAEEHRWQHKAQTVTAAMLAAVLTADQASK